MWNDGFQIHGEKLRLVSTLDKECQWQSMRVFYLASLCTDASLFLCDCCVTVSWSRWNCVPGDEQTWTTTTGQRCGSNFEVRSDAVCWHRPHSPASVSKDPDAMKCIWTRIRVAAAARATSAPFICVVSCNRHSYSWIAYYYIENRHAAAVVKAMLSSAQNQCRICFRSVRNNYAI